MSDVSSLASKRSALSPDLRIEGFDAVFPRFVAAMSSERFEEASELWGRCLLELVSFLEEGDYEAVLLVTQRASTELQSIAGAESTLISAGLHRALGALEVVELWARQVRIDRPGRQVEARPNLRLVLEALRENAPITQSDLGLAVQLRPNYLSGLMRELERYGFVTRTKEGKFVLYRPSSTGLRVLDRYWARHGRDLSPAGQPRKRVAKRSEMQPSRLASSAGALLESFGQRVTAQRPVVLGSARLWVDKVIGQREIGRQSPSARAQVSTAIRMIEDSVRQDERTLVEAVGPGGLREPRR